MTAPDAPIVATPAPTPYELTIAALAPPFNWLYLLLTVNYMHKTTIIFNIEPYPKWRQVKRFQSDEGLKIIAQNLIMPSC